MTIISGNDELRAATAALDPLEMLLDAARFADSIKPGWAAAARMAVAEARRAPAAVREALEPFRDAVQVCVATASETAIREALEFYADPWAWKKLNDPDDLIRIPDFYSELSFGGAAQEALAAIEAASKRPILSVSGNIHREQQRNTMGVTAGETATNSPPVAETDADAPEGAGLVRSLLIQPPEHSHEG